MPPSRHHVPWLALVIVLCSCAADKPASTIVRAELVRFFEDVNPDKLKHVDEFLLRDTGFSCVPACLRACVPACLPCLVPRADQRGHMY
jgi:hypothetical protein